MNVPRYYIMWHIFIKLFTLSIFCAYVHLYPVNDNYDYRIVGGHQTDIAVHPHQISLRYKSIFTPANPFVHRCGGSIIAADLVLTAAHCIIGTVPSEFKVVAGTNNRRGTDGVVISVAEIFMHEYYNPTTYDNDIALLRLATSLPLNNYNIKVIKLAEYVPLNDDICTITGWGAISEGGQTSETLLEVHVPIVSNDLCNEDYGAGRITDSMLCAGVRNEGGKDACQGDSGGPLIIRNILFGIVSWGSGCARPEYPGVYANVAYLLPWIQGKITQLS